ncbi:peptide-N(4)-(N-acetyl-beta-glucosaminyl)asparagine amidase isoform X1 [Leguminivora glycinivorella]|uniref:peptide-N(4)-(N-acetyl-beta- glucosaminyl)asparagine amidase isoform X1 n=1 Tax=Leguminivora glycinivorella TaxID=1035111 RepID=UPI00200EBC5C|nr:peptide-N(4)-(N-acetyl-beta-glucosaminyl)asparagine amidase isoform X1 [Leguminivora glycinivorella]XP_047997383.1 peptide-N(4)-(N-acetyl-beta-glucosaminyl)asparagine amidase isoform X1 [Leguminivora glycinivorella]XP_047997384.1 peptide-N(4)-(N-acetyl-beta-glucosaminyl)asparagine amidase isoform X1 [Leguminivora glycinivorella]
MEDIARLALVEQSLGGVDSFSKILYELLNVIYQILENPHDYELRTLKSEVLKKVLHSEAFTDYLKYVGFRANGNEYVYPKEETLSKLRIAQAAIERKIYFCCGSLSRVRSRPIRSNHSLQPKKVKFAPSNVLTTKNPFLRNIETLFNNMIQYESEELQELAREQIPLVTLQLMALDRVREQQKKIKTGETKDYDLSFDVALLLELLGWFKYKFFSWVDKPPCSACDGQTGLVRTQSMRVGGETCNVEIYSCQSCHTETHFPRHNDPLTLLRTRRGRCGEWANCFTLMCRALSYETRYVYDTTDHVWCEIFDVESNQWLHVDPCEGKLNTPLMYCHGWGKKLSYIIAVSRDDLQDVTWRYTMDHKEVLTRRNQCSEQELLSTILSLREHRQKQVSPARRQCLARRTLQELVQLMVERKPSEYESHGRISGERAWRTQRGEAGKYTFKLASKGTYEIKYYCALDKYEILLDGKLVEQINTWEAGVYEVQDVFRKVEHDWHMVYLAREEGASLGRVSWRLEAGEGLTCTSLEAVVPRTEYEDGRVTVSVRFDDEMAETAPKNDRLTYSCRWRACAVSAALSGGGGAGWQRAQLARQAAADTAPALTLRAHLQ